MKIPHILKFSLFLKPLGGQSPPCPPCGAAPAPMCCLDLFIVFEYQSLKIQNAQPWLSD